MKILNIRVMRGPNYWSIQREQLIVMKVDLEESVDVTTDKINGISQRLEALLPSLHHQYDIERAAYDLIEKVNSGILYADVIKHIAMEIQSLAGMPCDYGHTSPTRDEGIYHIVFGYQVEDAGRYAAEAAVRITENLIHNTACDIQKEVDELMDINRKYSLGPSTLSIVKTALQRDIPVRRLDKGSLIMLGQGKNQKILDATIASTTGCVGVDIAADKIETKRILSEGYIPVPDGRAVYSLDELKSAIDELGFPLAIKPFNSSKGRGITTNIMSEEVAITAFNKARDFSEKIIVERSIKGHDYRFLVINYKLEAVARRTPAMVTGDGRSSIKELIDKINSDPHRGTAHEKILTRINIDQATLDILAAHGMTVDSILPQGEILFLKDTANLSTGGTARDATDIVHPRNVFMAERVARLIGLDICGIDLIAADISEPITKENGAVLEVNAAPGFRMHLAPTRGLARNVAEAVIKMLYPEGNSCRIPVVAITGTNGKTTTARLIAHFAKNAGHTVGYTTTDGIYINDQVIHMGDCSGPASAETILRDPAVDFAVLECARGGILRAGLGFDKCNISIITNITEDHLGLNDIHSLEELAKVKSVVARSTFTDGYAILNADDDLVYAMKDELECNVALFSIYENNRRVKDHCEAGGWAAIIEKGYFTICQGEWRIRIAKVNEVPLTLEGRALCMIKNILPSILAASLAGFETRVIRKSLQAFIPGPELTPGRMNIFSFGSFDVMIDYVHNTDGFEQLKEFMKLVPAQRKVGIIGCAGDRRDQDIIRMGKSVAEMFDEIIIRHDKDGRGRTDEELTELITRGVNSVRPDAPVMIISDELDALQYAIDQATEGTFIVDSSDAIHQSIEFVKQKQNEKGAMIPETSIE
jgi:cyanophycin synthetase